MNTKLTTSDQTPRWVPLSVAAEYIHGSTKTLRRMLASGEITGYKFGDRFIRVDLNELDAKFKAIPNAVNP